jgi:hypothetical protein
MGDHWHQTPPDAGALIVRWTSVLPGFLRYQKRDGFFYGVPRLPAATLGALTESDVTAKPPLSLCDLLARKLL